MTGTLYAAQALVASRTRIRRVRRGAPVKPPADHARHLVSLLSRVPGCPKPESDVLVAYSERYCDLVLATFPGGVR